MDLEYRLKIAGPDAEWKAINADNLFDAGKELVQINELYGPINVRNVDTKEQVVLDDAPYGYNGGQRCDVRSGPCSCGAWH